MEELIHWNQQVLRDLNFQRQAIGLNEREQYLLDGLQRILSENIDRE